MLLFKEVSIPLKLHGTFQILTNINKNSDMEKEIIKIASNCGFQHLENNIDYKIYLLKGERFRRGLDWRTKWCEESKE